MIKIWVYFALFALGVNAKIGPEMPKLTLPWGTWEATRFPDDKEIYVFRNVRFGSKPERFGAPSFPDWINDTIQDSRGGRSCIQIRPNELKNAPGGKHRLFEPPHPSIIQDEDCLFLDIYVPVKAFRKESTKLPVVVWLYGGGYAFGSKDQFSPLYTGQSLLEASNYETIFVTGNYRLGAFGWLAGSYMQERGQPNAGLYDQALLFEWVQDHIGQVRGDRHHVSAWGQSAGAGSILHHLIRDDGRKDPNFATYLVQSPAFEWQWDNSKDGTLDKTYRTFSKLSGCGDKYDIDCLRRTNPEKLAEANQALFSEVKQTGLFPIGPSVDGNWVKTIPTLAFSEGKYWKDIWSSVISHCANEAQSFTPNTTDSQAKFDDFLDLFLPGNQFSSVKDQIRERYDCKTHFKGNYTNCLREVIQDSSFTCNTRDLFDAYPDTSYMMEYAFPTKSLAYHASDVIPLFSNTVQQVLNLLELALRNKVLAKVYAKVLESVVARRYKAYFASFAVSGDPNNLRDITQLAWPVADGSKDELSSVLQVRAPWPFHPTFHFISDKQNSKKRCDFWNNIAKQIVEVVTVAPNDQQSVLQDPSIVEEL